MLLTLTTTHAPARDLGYLLGKNPDVTQSFDLSFGRAHVFYPEATTQRCTAALVLEIDSIGLVRGPHRNDLSAYTSDRPYVASSFLSVAISRVLGSALNGHSKARPELAETRIPLEANVSVVPARGDGLVRKLFEPLGYAVALTPIAAQGAAHVGEARYAHLRLRATVRVSELLRHLTVLVPVMDDLKHYWVGVEEVDKLLARGEGWLAQHPARELISQRYLKHQRGLTRLAVNRLHDEARHDDADLNADEVRVEGSAGVPEPEPEPEPEHVPEPAATSPSATPLNEQRLDAVVTAARRLGARRILDAGCGEGRLLRKLIAARHFERIAGMDVSSQALGRAAERTHLGEVQYGNGNGDEHQAALFQGSLCYRDRRLDAFDTICLVEVIEHIDLNRLPQVEHALFGAAKPALVIVTTPNAEYNALYPHLEAGKFRHRDHRFEWTREQFEHWAQRIAKQHGYDVCLEGIGAEHHEHGAPTQMGLFTR